jgi:hypothetical protein
MPCFKGLEGALCLTLTSRSRHRADVRARDCSSGLLFLYVFPETRPGKEVKVEELEYVEVGELEEE